MGFLEGVDRRLPGAAREDLRQWQCILNTQVASGRCALAAGHGVLIRNGAAGPEKGDAP